MMRLSAKRLNAFTVAAILSLAITGPAFGQAKRVIDQLSEMSGNLPQSRITSLTSDLAAKAADSSVVHLSGTESIAGLKTFAAPSDTSQSLIVKPFSGSQTANMFEVRDSSNGVRAAVDSLGELVRDHTNSALSQYALKILPGGNNPPIALSSIASDNGDSTFNTVLTLGHNQQIGNSQFYDGTRHTAAFNIEYDWLNQGGEKQAEFYWYVNKPDGTSTRPVFAQVPHALAGWATILALNASTLNFQSEDQATPKVYEGRSGGSDGSYSWIVYNGANPNGSGGFPLSFNANASGNTDITLGLNSKEVSLTLNSSASLAKIVGGTNAQASFGVAGDIDPSARLGITTSASILGLHVTQSASSQNAIQVDTSGGATTFSVAPLGQTLAHAANAGTVPLAAQAASGQTANVFECWDSNGNPQLAVSKDFWLGIGTPTPGQLLHVVGSGFASAVVGRRTDAASASALLVLDSSSSVWSLQNSSGTLIGYSGGTIGSATGTARFGFDATGNFGLGTTSAFGSGQGVIGLANAAVLPSTNPSGGGVLYVDSGTLKYRGPSGTITTLAAP